jgi:site-specific DNA-methyltransferase (adenine-specific)
MNAAQLKAQFRSATFDWPTPRSVYDALDAEFHFDYDPCPFMHSPAPLFGSFDGLLETWGTVTFCNPPYKRVIGTWIKKGYYESRLGKTVVFLIPSRTDTKWWHDYVMKADEIRFVRGRLKFGGSKINAPFPSAIAVFRPERT